MSTDVAVAGRIFLGPRTDFPEGTRRIVQLPEDEVGVMVHGGAFYAYRNRCLHQGGPVCEGTILGKVEANLRPDKTVVGEYFSETDAHLICPWHGVEFHLADGRCVTNPRLRLRKYEIELEGDDVYLVTG
jgi:nitrite reductase/ring-hydroxylating ferredoxin subunit